MDAIKLDRDAKITLLRWLEQGFAPADEMSALYKAAQRSLRSASDYDIVGEMMRIDKQMDGEIIGGYRLHFCPERYEKILTN